MNTTEATKEERRRGVTPGPSGATPRRRGGVRPRLCARAARALQRRAHPFGVPHPGRCVAVRPGGADARRARKPGALLGSRQRRRVRRRPGSPRGGDAPDVLATGGRHGGDGGRAWRGPRRRGRARRPRRRRAAQRLLELLVGSPPPAVAGAAAAPPAERFWERDLRRPRPAAQPGAAARAAARNGAEPCAAAVEVQSRLCALYPEYELAHVDGGDTGVDAATPLVANAPVHGDSFTWHVDADPAVHQPWAPAGGYANGARGVRSSSRSSSTSTAVAASGTPRRSSSTPRAASASTCSRGRGAPS